MASLETVVSPASLSGDWQALMDALPFAAVRYALDERGQPVSKACNARARQWLARPEGLPEGESLRTSLPMLAGDGLIGRLRHVAQSGQPMELDEMPAADPTAAVRYQVWAFPAGARSAVLAVRELRLAPRAVDEQRPPQGLQADDCRQQVLFDLIPEPLALMDRHSTRFIEVNQAWIDRFGYTRDQARGRTSLELNLWVDPAQREEVTARVVRERQVLAMPVRLRARDGAMLHAELSLKVVKAAGGAVLLWLAHDRTAQRRAEEARHLSETKLAIAFWAVPDAISLTRLDDGRIVDVNEAWQRLTGYGRDEVIGRTTVDIKVWQPRQRVVLMRTLERKGSVRELEMTLRTRAGDDRICLVNAKVLPLDGVPHLLGVVRDVTQERRARLALEASERRYRALFDAARDAIFLTRGETFIQCNQAALQLFACTRSQILGHSASRFSPQMQPDGRASEAAAALVVEAALAGEPQFFEWVHLRIDGSAFDAEVSVNRVAVMGETLLLAMVRDVTPRKQTERRLSELADHLRELNQTLERRVEERTRALHQAADELMQSEKLAALGRLVAGVAHELNTPIGNSLLAATTLVDRTQELAAELETGLRRSTLQSYMDDARANATLLSRNLQRAGELIASFKQVAVDRTSAHHRSFLLRDLVAENLMMLKPSLKGRPVLIEESVPGDLWMDSYPGPLGQVLTNLVHNALVHAFPDERAGCIRISAECVDEEILLRVADDGCGIPVEHLRSIFEPFFTTALGRGGSGLGLHIVHTLVDSLLGGRIEVASRLQAGSTFTLYLPAVVSTGAARPPVEGVRQ